MSGMSFSKENPYIDEITGCKYWTEDNILYYQNGKTEGGQKLSYFINNSLWNAIEFDEGRFLNITMRLGLYASFTAEQKSILEDYQNGEHKKKGKGYSQNKESYFLNDAVWQQVNYYRGFGIGLEEIYTKVGKNLHKSDSAIRSNYSKLRKVYLKHKRDSPNGVIPREIGGLYLQRKHYFHLGEQHKELGIDQYSKSR